MREARGSGSPAFHEWRKRIKTLWYVLRLLEQRVPVDPQLTELKRLEEWLGDDHNLVVRYNAATAHECIQTTADVAGESAAAPERRFVDERADEEVGG